LASRARPVAGAGRLTVARRVARSFGYAFEGLAALLRTQPNFGVHVVIALAVVVVALLLRPGPIGLALLALAIGVVLALEAMNTALEALCDLVSPGYHPLVKRAKDVSAAAVLIMAATAVVVGLAVLGPRLLDLVASH
jgi:diacylglycerol kinase